MRRALAASLCALLFLSAQAPTPTPDPARAIASIVKRNAAVRHYTFDVDAHIALLTFPWIRFELIGHGAYTRGGDYYVHFDRVPWFGHGFETMHMEGLDTATWPSTYSMQIESQQDDETIVIMHDPKHQHPLKDIHATFDPSGLREILWSYEYGGHVKLKIVPTTIDGHDFAGTEEAEIVMPMYRAMAWATYSNYKIETDATASAQ